MQRTRIAVSLIAGVSMLWSMSLTARAQDATPAATYTCDEVAAQSGEMPSPMMGDMSGMMGTPMAGMNQMPIELDQMYIDMMIPHHASIIAMAEAALPRLSDERLQDIAKAVIAAQGPEIEELRGYRQSFYGEAEPMPMNGRMMATMGQMMPDMMGMMPGMMSGMMGTMPGMKQMMDSMMQAMPGMTEDMAAMATMMNAEGQVAALCGAENPDLAFIDLTIVHHQMAITASREALDQAKHQEVRDFAQRVIDAQQREIDELTTIRQELTGEATPSP